MGMDVRSSESWPQKLFAAKVGKAFGEHRGKTRLDWLSKCVENITLENTRGC